MEQSQSVVEVLHNSHLLHHIFAFFIQNEGPNSVKLLVQVCRFVFKNIFAIMPKFTNFENFLFSEAVKPCFLSQTAVFQEVEGGRREKKLLARDEDETGAWQCDGSVAEQKAG